MRLYHLSEKKLTDIMIPRVPKSKYEDQKTKRICFSSSIQDCLIGINEDKDISGKIFHVYYLDTDDYITPTKEQVKDVDITKEIWYCKKYKPNFFCDIKVIDKKNEKEQNINGKKFKVPIWNYEKINMLKEEIIANANWNKERNIEKEESHFNY